MALYREAPKHQVRLPVGELRVGVKFFSLLNHNGWFVDVFVVFLTGKETPVLLYFHMDKDLVSTLWPPSCS